MSKPLHFKSLTTITEPELYRISKGILASYELGSLSNFNDEKALKNESKDLLARCEGYHEGFAEVRKRRAIANSIPDEQLHDQVITLPCGEIWVAGIYRDEHDNTLLEVFTEYPLSEYCLKSYLPSVIDFFNWATIDRICLYPVPNSSIQSTLLKYNGAYLGDSFLGVESHAANSEPEHSLTLRLFDINKDWPWYEEQYALFHQQKPELAKLVDIEKPEDILDAIDNHLCYVAERQVQDKAHRVGMIMAEQSMELGYNGVLFSDILVAQDYRGKGYAASIQRTLIKQLKTDYTFFNGYIYTQNYPSFFNALKQNRAVLRQELMIPITHFYNY